MNLNMPVFVFPNLGREQCSAYYTSDAFGVFGSDRCKSPWYEVTVVPDGSVTPCMELSMGNIHEESFSSIWNGPKFVHFRETILKRSFPYCIRCCGLHRY